MAKCKSLMVQGTGSDVGKTILVAGLCRLAANMGLRVMPFKPQNMSNNAAVTKKNSGEIGRAQYLQALAARVEPCVDMNPILLKPQSETGSQLIVQGQVEGVVAAGEYQTMREKLLPKVLQSYARLQKSADLILVEGAGSCAEMNLRKESNSGGSEAITAKSGNGATTSHQNSDIANMGFACAADVPVVLLADIERGGVLANIVGTHKLLPENERERIKGYIINKFRGDEKLFTTSHQQKSAIDIIYQHTKWNCLGIVPYLESVAILPDEDSVVLSKKIKTKNNNNNKTKIIVPVLSRISNFDDLDPLKHEKNIELIFLRPQDEWPQNAKLVILSGSKSTIADMQQFQKYGGAEKLNNHIKRGGHVLGICGGYQMLGNFIVDEKGVEGKAGKFAGLGLLDIETKLEMQKTVKQTEASSVAFQSKVSVYEIHMGKTSGKDTARPMFYLENGAGGASSANGVVQGCYLHGLFANDEWREAYLASLGVVASSGIKFNKMLDEALDSLANDLEKIFGKSLFLLAN